MLPDGHVAETDAAVSARLRRAPRLPSGPAASAAADASVRLMEFESWSSSAICKSAAALIAVASSLVAAAADASVRPDSGPDSGPGPTPGDWPRVPSTRDPKGCRPPRLQMDAAAPSPESTGAP